MGHLAGECPVCKKTFLDGDDIVICPSCGAPYHRACYQKSGHCLFEEKHGTGFEYAAAGAAPRGAASDTAPGARKHTREKANSGGVLCRQCNTVNDAKNIFCENCGSPLHGTASQAASAEPPPFGGFGAGPAYGAMPYGEAVTGQIDGIPASDWSAFIGPSAPIYLQRMSIMQNQNRPVSFLFSAFLFSPTYFAYRKMWGWAAVSLAATLLFMVPSLLWTSADAGFNLVPMLSLQVLSTLNSVFSYLSLAMRLAFGMFALRLYKNNAKKHILAIREQTDGHGEYHALLARAGGVSLGAVVIVVALIFTLTSIFLSLGGPDFINALMTAYYPGL